MAEGLRVRTLSRHSVPSYPDQRVEHWVGDIRDDDVVRRAVDGVDMVLHLAAVLHQVDPAAQRRADYGSINTGATRTLSIMPLPPA